MFDEHFDADSQHGAHACIIAVTNSFTVSPPHVLLPANLSISTTSALERSSSGNRDSVGFSTSAFVKTWTLPVSGASPPFANVACEWERKRSVPSLTVWENSLLVIYL